MKVGSEYALRRKQGGVLKVTMLDTDPQRCGRAKVRIRFEEGLSKGKESTVPSARIVRPWNRDDAPSPRNPTTRVQVVKGAWPPEPRGLVCLKGMNGLAWTVTTVDCVKQRATIESKVFGRPQSREVSWDDLEQYEERRKVPVQTEPGDSGEPGLSRGSRPSPHDLYAPEKPRRALDEVIEQLTFSPQALGRYRRRLAPDASTSEAHERLLKELRFHGYLHEPKHDEELPRPPVIRVNGRFDVVLRGAADGRDGSIYVNETDLRIVKGAGRQRKRPRRRAA